MLCVGYKKSSFTPKGENTAITGYNIYLTYPVTGPDGEGVVADRVYMTEAKLAKCGYKPKVGDEVAVVYNRYGKPEAITKV